MVEIEIAGQPAALARNREGVWILFPGGIVFVQVSNIGIFTVFGELCHCQGGEAQG